MPNVLKNIVAFAGLLPGVPTTLPHGLVDANGLALLPDHLESSNGDVAIVSADATDVTVRNDGLAAAAANILVERWYTEDRAFPAGASTLPGLPFVPAGGSSSSGGVASNVRLTGLGGATLTIFANATGNDATGDGSSGNPYRTFVRAMQDVPVFVKGGVVLVDITNLGTEALPAPVPGSFFNFAIGPHWGDSFFTIDFAPALPGQAELSGVTVRADPTIVETGLGSFTQAVDATTGRRTITFDVDPGFVPGALIGALVQDNGNDATARVVSNTSDVVVTTEASTAFVGPVDFARESAELVSGAGGGVGVEVNSANLIQFQGIHFSGGAGIDLNPTSGVGLIRVKQCRFEGAGGFFATGVARVEMDACWFEPGQSVAISSIGNISTCFFDGVDWSLRGSGVGDSLFMTENSLLACTNFGQALGSGYQSPSIAIQLDRMNIDTPGGDGVGVRFAVGHSQLRRTFIEGCSGDAVEIGDNCFVRLRDVDGSVGNTAFGVRLLNGAQARIDAATSVTGVSGDVQVGGNAAATTYAGFPATDLAAGAPQLCRVFGP